MNTSKQLELLNLLKKNIKLALPLKDENNDWIGVAINIDFWETDEEKIELLKEWLSK